MTTEIDYGTDWSTFPGLDQAFAPLSGVQAVGQAVARSLLDERRGIDVRNSVNDDVTLTSLYNLQQAIVSQCLVDERLKKASAVITQTDLKSLSIDIDLQPSDGSPPFKLVITVPKLTVAILEGHG